MPIHKMKMAMYNKANLVRNLCVMHRSLSARLSSAGISLPHRSKSFIFSISRMPAVRLPGMLGLWCRFIEIRADLLDKHQAPDLKIVLADTGLEPILSDLPWPSFCSTSPPLKSRPLSPDAFRRFFMSDRGYPPHLPLYSTPASRLTARLTDYLPAAIAGRLKMSLQFKGVHQDEMPAMSH